MERRKEPRLNVRQPVALTVLDVRSNHLLDGCVLNISGSGLRVRTASPVPCGSAVRIDAINTLMLGEICRCEPEDGAYAVSVEVSETISSLTDVEMVNRALFGAKPGHKLEISSDFRASRR